jgi:hypothetical protein
MLSECRVQTGEQSRRVRVKLEAGVECCRACSSGFRQGGVGADNPVEGAECPNQVLAPVDVVEEAPMPARVSVATEVPEEQPLLEIAVDVTQVISQRVPYRVLRRIDQGLKQVIIECSEQARDSSLGNQGPVYLHFGRVVVRFDIGESESCGMNVCQQVV